MATKSDPKQKTGLSRREFLKVLSAAGGATALSACGLAGIQSPAPTASATPSPTLPPPGNEPTVFDGYSIFHQTMVDLPWPEIKQAAQDGAIILLPVAVIEEHGPHMGLGADVYQTYLLCKLTREILEAEGIKTLIAPPYYWGISVSTAAFPGSFSVQPETMKAVLYDIHASLFQWGFKYVFSLNLHGDSTHRRILAEAILKVREELRKGAFLVSQGLGIVLPDFPGASRLSQKNDFHAGAYETAQMLADFPMDVNTELAKILQPSNGFEPAGYYGDPASFDVLNTEEIKNWNRACCAAIAEWIETTLKAQK
jgi:creatinine amidohydrolase